MNFGSPTAQIGRSSVHSSAKAVLLSQALCVALGLFGNGSLAGACDPCATNPCGPNCRDVLKLQYFDELSQSWVDVDVTKTMYVWLTTSVTFKAISDAAGGGWPDGTPTWSGTAGASGTGPTKIVGFSTKSTSTTD
jgi:hypothetical protein